MNIRLKYFGSISDHTACMEEYVEIESGKLEDLIARLKEKYPKLKDKQYQIAQGKVMIDLHATLTGEEIALLPPFSGG